MENAKIETVSSRNEPVARFGPFELRLRTGELRKHGVRVRLQTKPFQILRALIEQAGHVVTREELKERLWASDTFVDFESGLNTAVNRLRMALGDSAENPIYVETLSRIGYRFLAPVVLSAEERGEMNGFVGVPVREGASNGYNPVLPVEISRRSSVKWIVAGAASVFVLCVAGVLLSNINGSRRQPVFRQITFRQGFVNNARFTADAKTVVFSAAWNGEPSQLFLLNPAKPEPRILGFRGSRIVSLSPSNELGIFGARTDSDTPRLESVPLAGGAPHPFPEHAVGADWGSDGTLCLIKEDHLVFSVECPPGRKIYTAKTGSISDLRVFSKDKIAFAEHPMLEDDAGRVMLMNSSGQARVLSSGWASLAGLAWPASGREVWFTAASSGIERALMAVDLSGHLRELARTPGGLQLHDIAPTGQVLIARTTERMTMTLRDVNQPAGRDISWLDWSRAVAISSDGKLVLFDESGSGGGKDYSVYIYRPRLNSTERIGTGRAMDLSPEGKWALTQSSSDATKLSWISIQNKSSTPVMTGGMSYRWAKFIGSRDVPEILFEGSGPNKDAQIYRQRLPDGHPIPLSISINCDAPIIDESGRFAMVTDGGHEITLFELTNGRTRSIKTAKSVYPVAFVNDNEILTSKRDNGSIILESLNLQTGASSLYRRLDSVVPPGVAGLFPLYIAKDLHTVVYSSQQNISDLFVVTGLK